MKHIHIQARNSVRKRAMAVQTVISYHQWISDTYIFHSSLTKAVTSLD